MSAFGLLSTVLVQIFIHICKILNHSLVSPIFSFAKGVEFVIVLGFAIAFFLLAIFITLRQAKRLPTSYSIDVTDVFGKTSAVDGLRLSFSTHSGAESYARLYRATYAGQYQFRVIGNQVHAR